jgi:hypothetical protein
VDPVAEVEGPVVPGADTEVEEDAVHAPPTIASATAKASQGRQGLIVGA